MASTAGLAALPINLIKSKMNLQSIVDYVQAGIDESLRKFFGGLVASMLLAGADYSYHHFSGSFLHLLSSNAYWLIGIPGLVAFWHWIKTNAEPAQTFPDGTVDTTVA